ncbi:MAG: class I cytochrome c [Terriglobia bacterium]|nr:MAG: class I cytochrome c [Terriglobia bacterium]
MKATSLALSIAALALVVCAQEPAPRSVWDGIYTRQQAEAGQASYTQYCSACHGDALTGGEMAPPLAGGDFLANWNGLTVGDLFDRIRTTMPLNNPQSLNRETNARILAYILSFNRFPSGAEEMSTRTEVLKMFRIEAEKTK